MFAVDFDCESLKQEPPEKRRRLNSNNSNNENGNNDNGNNNQNNNNQHNNNNENDSDSEEQQLDTLRKKFLYNALNNNLVSPK